MNDRELQVICDIHHWAFAKLAMEPERVYHLIEIHISRVPVHCGLFSSYMPNVVAPGRPLTGVRQQVTEVCSLPLRNSTKEKVLESSLYDIWKKSGTTFQRCLFYILKNVKCLKYEKNLWNLVSCTSAFKNFVLWKMAWLIDHFISYPNYLDWHIGGQPRRSMDFMQWNMCKGNQKNSIFLTWFIHFCYIYIYIYEASQVGAISIW